jgi:hypothetical protein
MKIGIIKGGFFDVREINEYQTKMELPDGSISTVIMTVEAQLEEYESKGWKPVEDIDTLQLECSEMFFSTEVLPIDKGDVIGFTYQKRLDKRLVAREIERLKTELSESDYKVTKCYEASLLGEELPYNIVTVHSERQSLRDTINQLENLV